jgi:hypothetical protein
MDDLYYGLLLLGFMIYGAPEELSVLISCDLKRRKKWKKNKKKGKAWSNILTWLHPKHSGSLIQPFFFNKLLTISVTEQLSDIKYLPEGNFNVADFHSFTICYSTMPKKKKKVSYF